METFTKSTKTNLKPQLRIKYQNVLHQYYTYSPARYNPARSTSQTTDEQSHVSLLSQRTRQGVAVALSSIFYQG